MRLPAVGRRWLQRVSEERVSEERVSEERVSEERVSEGGYPWISRPGDQPKQHTPTQEGHSAAYGIAFELSRGRQGGLHRKELRSDRGTDGEGV